MPHGSLDLDSFPVSLHVCQVQYEEIQSWPQSSCRSCQTLRTLPYLKVSENLIEREGYDCKVRKVYIETDSYWNIDTLSDWIRASKYPDMIMLSFEQNTTDGPRFGKIIIRSANRSHTITVIQHAIPLTIRPSKNSNNHYANSDENEETEYEYGDPDSPDYEGQRDKFGNYPEKDGKYPSKYGHHPDKYGPLDKYPYPKPQ